VGDGTFTAIVVAVLALAGAAAAAAWLPARRPACRRRCAPQRIDELERVRASVLSQPLPGRMRN
jgi:hypothetical protein